MLNGTHVVLLVDDDQEPLDLLEHYFERNQYITKTAHSVTEAIQKLDGTLDLIVTDYELPIMSGADLLLMVRQKFPKLPVIGISGLRFMNGNRIDQLFDAFLPKPFRINDLRESVAKVILWASAVDEPLIRALSSAR
jgi:CheY-like chemotaxis protein